MMSRPSIVKSRTDHDFSFRWFPVKDRRRTVAALPLRSLPVTERQPLIQWENCSTDHWEPDSAADADGVPGGNENGCGTTSDLCRKATTSRGSKSTAKSKLQHRGSRSIWDGSPDDEELKPLANENYDTIDCRRTVVGSTKQYRSISSLADRPQRLRQGLSATMSVDTTPVGHQSWIRRTPSWPSALIKVKDMILEKVSDVTSFEWAHDAAVERERRQHAATTFQMSLIETGSRKTSTKSSGKLHSRQQTGSRKTSTKSSGESHSRRQTGSRKTSTKSSGESHSRQLRAATATRHSAGDRDRFSGDDLNQLSKSALRRRSASENTFDQPLTTTAVNRRTLTGSTTLAQSSVTLRRAGIICSDDDLRSIVYEHRVRLSLTRRQRPESFDSRTSSSVQYSPLRPLLPNNDDIIGCESSASDHPDKLPDELLFRNDVIMTSPVPYHRKSAVWHKTVPEENGQMLGIPFDPEILGRAIQEHLDKLMARSVTWTKTPEKGCLPQQRASLRRSATTADCRSAVTKGVTGGGGYKTVEFIVRHICSPWEETRRTTSTTQPIGESRPLEVYL